MEESSATPLRKVVFATLGLAIGIAAFSDGLGTPLVQLLAVVASRSANATL